MQVSVHRRSHGAVVDVRGRFVYGEPVRDLHECVRRLVSQGIAQVVIDLGETSTVDSVGLEALVASYATCMKSGARLKVINANSKARKALHVTKLDSLFDVAASN